MAKLSVGQKAVRVLKLLLGLRNARVAEALRQYGFTDADLAEGWRLLQALTEGRMQRRPPAKQDPAFLAQLDDWENRWFPIAAASLRGRYPDVHEWLFLNLAQTEGARSSSPPAPCSLAWTRWRTSPRSARAASKPARSSPSVA